MATRIDYSDPAVMHRRAADAHRRRGTATTHPYVVGRWTYNKGVDRVAFYAVEADPATAAAALPIRLTCTVSKWVRWRTRQAPHQWLAARPELSHLQVLNLDSLDATAEL